MDWTAPHPALVVLWILWIFQSIWGLFNVQKFRSRSVRLQRRSKRRDDQEGLYTPGAVVIIPVKGADEHFSEHVHALAGQEYPEYRLLFAVAETSDPAFAALTSLRGQTAVDLEVVVAGRAVSGGQKVHNQLAALQSLKSTDEAIVFADADAVPHDRWLHALIQPLRREVVGASTGYRWMVPAEGAPFLPSAICSTINASIATLLGKPRWNFAWGGSMAMTREMLDQCGLREAWDRALSDDYQLSHAVHEQGKIVEFAPDCLVRSPVRHGWGSLWEFGRRQYSVTWVYARWVWWAALGITLLYNVGWISALVVLFAGLAGSGWAVVAFGMVYIFDVMRAAIRSRAVRDLMGPAMAAQWYGPALLESLVTPFIMLVHGVIILSTLGRRRIRWAGIGYHMAGPRDVRIQP